MKNEKKKVLLIVNPCAGREKSRAGTFEIIDKFSQNDYEFAVHTTKCQGDATQIVKDHLDENNMVVCCGGDGTLNETINGVMSMTRRVPIGYIPTGTTNDLASTIGIPRGIKEATDLIMSGKTNDYDIGLFNNRYFSYIASFGTFSKSSYMTSQKMKNRFGHLAYVVNGLSDLAHIIPYKMKIEHDGGVLEGEFVFGTISNSTSVGGIFKLDEEQIKLNDGYFEVMLISKIRISKVPKTFFEVRRQEYDGKQVIFFKTKKLKLVSQKALDWTLDGEYGGKHNTVMMHVLERAVEVCSGDSHLFLPKIEFEIDEPTNDDEVTKKSIREKLKGKAKNIDTTAMRGKAKSFKESLSERFEEAEEKLEIKLEELTDDVKDEIEDVVEDVIEKIEDAVDEIEEAKENEVKLRLVQNGK